MFASVTEFHRAFSLPIGTTASLPDTAQRSLRKRLLVEEFTELEVAERDDDIVEVADALADMAYIICGTMIVYGIVPLDYIPPLASILNAGARFPEEFVRSLLIGFVTSDYKAYLDAEDADDLDAIKRALLRLVGSIHAVAYSYAIPLNRVFAEVHRSNMTKLDPETGKPIIRHDGKVMKPPSFSRPDIAALLQPTGDAA